jgi:hypothetical protein
MTARLSLNENSSLTVGDPIPRKSRRKPFSGSEPGQLDELLVHPYVRGIAYAEGFFELDKGRTALQEPYGEGVA